ncbi:MAG: TolC family protein [Candidatus Binatia bacterium]
MPRHLVVLVCALLAGSALWAGDAAAVEAAEHHTPTAPAHVRRVPVTIRKLKGEHQVPIDYRSALRLAAAKNLDILQARARLMEDRGARLRAIGRLLPSLSAGLETARIDGEIQASFGELGRRKFSTINPAGRVSLRVNPGEAIFELLAAHKRVGAAEHASDGVTQETLARVATQYFSLQAAEAQVGIAASAVQTAKELRRLAYDRATLGVGLEADAARAEARLAQEEVALTSAEERFRDASVDLADTLRLDPAVVLVPLEANVRQLELTDAHQPLPQLLDRALAQRPELRALGLRAAAAADAQAAAWWKALGPSAYGAVEESGIGRSFAVGNRQIYEGFVGWTLTPSSVGETRAAAARLEQTQLHQDQLKQAIRAEVVRARDLVFTAKLRISAGRRGVAAAQQSLTLSQDRFTGGAGLELEVIEAQEALTTARTALVQAIAQYNAAQVRLIRAVGDVSVATLTAFPTAPPGEASP